MFQLFSEHEPYFPFRLQNNLNSEKGMTFDVILHVGLNVLQTETELRSLLMKIRTIFKSTV